MAYLKADPRWRGSLAQTPYVLVAALIASLIVLIISWSLIITDKNRVTTIKFLYYEAIPLLSLWHTAISLTCHQYAKASPIACLVFDILYLGAWIVISGFWAMCEGGKQWSGLDGCPSWSGQGSYSVQHVKLGFSICTLLLYVVLVGCSCGAVVREKRKARGKEVGDIEMDR